MFCPMCFPIFCVSSWHIFAVKGQAGIVLGFEGHAAHHSHSLLLLEHKSLPRQHVTRRHVCVPIKRDLQDQVAGGVVVYPHQLSSSMCIFFCSKPLMYLLVQILGESFVKDFCLSSPSTISIQLISISVSLAAPSHTLAHFGA